MRRIVAMGAEPEVDVFAMVGIAVLSTDGRRVSELWEELDDDVGLVILTRGAAEAVGGALRTPSAPLWVVLP